MNKELLDYIQSLSKRDIKSLSGKALKGAEEVGELAKFISPYENAFGTNHRFVTRQSILEETADTMLAVMSCAYDVGFTHDDLEAMLWRKAAKWDNLMTQESGIKWPLPYEIHVTVASGEVENFKEDCKELGVKPIFLDLQDNDGNTVLKDIMTSSVHMGTNTSAYKELERIADGLTWVGYDVVRKKIETVPWHPAAPSKNNNMIMPKDCYFESHLNIVITANHQLEQEARLQKLRQIMEACNAHLSRNIFKRIDEQNFIIMGTYRSYKGILENFKHSVEELKLLLNYDGFQVEKEIVEFSIYDTKVNHDEAWIANRELTTVN